jgi:hypothetical protein
MRRARGKGGNEESAEETGSTSVPQAALSGSIHPHPHPLLLLLLTVARCRGKGAAAGGLRGEAGREGGGTAPPPHPSSSTLSTPGYRADPPGPCRCAAAEDRALVLIKRGPGLRAVDGREEEGGVPESSYLSNRLLEGVRLRAVLLGDLLAGGEHLFNRIIHEACMGLVSWD